MQSVKKQKKYGVSFDIMTRKFVIKLYAPDVSEVKLNINDEIFIPLEKYNDEFLLKTNKLKFNDRYSFLVDGVFEIPDPFSNYQDKKNNLKSVVIKHDEVNWDDKNFRAVGWADSIIYQLHVGCFTKGGNFSDAKFKLKYLKDLGINCVQLMPTAKFFGGFNWGYDSALHFAVDEKYGTPNEFKNFINEAHKNGISVFLDVVYSHFAIEGNYLHLLASSKIYDEKIKTPWGKSINYKNKFIQDYIIQNVEFWIKNYHVDGFRLDASQVIDNNLLYKIKDIINIKYPNIKLILENEDNQAHYLKNGFDAQWNDDFHHSLKAGLFSDKYKYLADYNKDDFSLMMLKSITQGYIFQGEYSDYKKELKGESTEGLSLTKFINFIQNHDQIGNRIEARRFNSIASKNQFKACALLYLLLPSIPMIFMGEEFNSKTPFYYFCDFSDELNEVVEKNRKDDFKLYGGLKNYTPSYLESTFLSSKLDWNNLDYEILDFYRTILSLRKVFIEKVYKTNPEIRTNILSDNVFKIEYGDKLSLIANFSNLEIFEDTKNMIISSKALNEFDDGKIPAMTTLWCFDDKQE